MASTIISCKVHVDAETRISCQAVRSTYWGFNTVRLDDLCIFATEPELRRLVHAISERLAVIETETVQTAP